MSGQPPVVPPTLSYKSKAEKEREEREREELERQEAQRLEQERQAKDAFAAEQAAIERTRAQPDSPPALTDTPAPAMETGLTRKPVPEPDGIGMFSEDDQGLTLQERAGIEMLGTPDEAEIVEEAEEEVEAEPELKRMPPRPPKSPDMRPVYAGFILVFTGLAQFIWGVLAMWNSPDAASGLWAPLIKWGAFSMGFIAAFLGLLAIRGGLWSFRKERFDIVKIGAISATACVWAWWIPWLFGALALVIVHRARQEYYPFYDPAWDAPTGARPTPSVEEESEVGDEKEDDGTEEREAQEGDGLDWEGPAPGEGGDRVTG
jgi:hypothetical protein